MQEQGHATRATDILRREHRTIEGVLESVDELAAGRRRASAVTWAKVIEFLVNYADRCHHLKEEDILFPALLERGLSRDHGPIRCLLADHVQGRAHVQAMHDGLSAWDRDPDAARAKVAGSARSYVALLHFHIAKEDQMLFPLADSMLDERDQAALLERFAERECREMGEDVHRRYESLARSLREEAGLDGSPALARGAVSTSCMEGPPVPAAARRS